MEYSWKITKLISAKHFSGFGDVVRSVYWDYSLVDGDYSSRIQGVNELPEPNNNFIPYSGLTEDVVIGWIRNIVDENILNGELNRDINNQKNPPLVEEPLPWVPVQPDQIDEVI